MAAGSRQQRRKNLPAPAGFAGSAQHRCVAEGLILQALLRMARRLLGGGARAGRSGGPGREFPHVVRAWCCGVRAGWPAVIGLHAIIVIFAGRPERNVIRSDRRDGRCGKFHHPYHRRRGADFAADHERTDCRAKPVGRHIDGLARSLAGVAGFIRRSMPTATARSPGASSKMHLAPAAPIPPWPTMSSTSSIPMATARSASAN